MAGENSEMMLVCMRVCVRVCARARKCVSASVHIHHGLADVDTYKYISSHNFFKFPSLSK